MSSYFVNSTFPVSLPGGQDSLLGQIPLYSSGYTDPLRHYSNAATYGAANMQEKVYPASYYQQTGAAAAAIYGRAGGGAPCDYNPVGTFYKDAEGSCAFSSREEQPLFVTQEHQQRKAECPEQTVNMSSSLDDKSSTLIYPWMQRMNACSAGECKVRVYILYLYLSIYIYTVVLCHAGCLGAKERRSAASPKLCRVV